MRILGIDPALTRLGWGVITQKGSQIHFVNSGVCITTTNTPIHKRLSDINAHISEVLDTYKPSIVAMEDTFINMNAVSSTKLNYVRGAIMSLIGKYDLPFYEYKPNLVKKTVVGTGHADKEQVAHLIKIIVSGTYDLNTSDEADALAVAYTCLVHNKFV